ESATLHTEEDIQEAVATLESAGKARLAAKVGPALQRDNQAVYTKILGQIVETHMELRNKLDGVSFPQEGNVKPEAGEGARVKEALAGLRKLGEQEVTKQDYDEIIDHMKNLLHYPKIPANMLIDVNTPEGLAKWDEAKGKYNAGT